MTKNLRKFTLLPLAVLMITLALVTGQNPAVAQDPDAPVASFPGHYIPTMDGSGVDIDCGGRRPGLRGEYVCSISQAGNQITVVQQVRDNSEDGKVRDDTLTFTLSGSGGGLDQDAVDARIATFARVNNPSGEIGDARIPDSIARDSELPTTFGDLTGDIGESQIPASIARDSELPEQRVIDFGGNPTSPDNNLVIALGDGHARIVNHYETPGTNAADGGLADFTHANYRGVYANDSAAGTQVAVGQFYFNRHTQHFRERTGTVLASAIFQDFNIESLLLSGAHYQGSYATDQEGLNHSDEAGDVFFQTTSQKIRVTSNNFSAGSSPQTHHSYRRLADAEEVAASITAHDTSGTAHNDIRSDLSTVEDRLDALDPVEIEAYSSTATYSRGSANSIVTHANHVWVYRSMPRNTNHDPEQFPQYWWKLDTPIRVLNHDSATTTHWRSGDFFLTETSELRIATATISASPADIIADHTGADQEFLWLNEPSPISWGFVIDTLIVPELNQDAITDARIILEDSGLTHYLTFLDWTAANLDMIDHLPVGAHIGLRQGTTTRILEVQAEWDATNDRYRVINVNTGILSESASGTATELLLTAGAGGGGFTQHVGAGAPANSLGDDGDWYLRTSNGQWYEKVSGAWASRYTDQVGQAGSGITQTQGDARYARQSENLDDLDNAATARTNLGLGSAATQESSAFLTQDGGDSRYLNEASNLSDLPSAATARTNLGLGTAATRDTGTGQNNVPILDASGDIAAGIVPIDNTLQVDGSGDLGVNTQRVVQEVSEWVQHFATGDGHDTSGHSGKYHEYTSPNTHPAHRLGAIRLRLAERQRRRRHGQDLPGLHSRADRPQRRRDSGLIGGLQRQLPATSVPLHGRRADQPERPYRHRAASNGRRQQRRIEREGWRRIARQPARKLRRRQQRLQLRGPVQS